MADQTPGVEDTAAGDGIFPELLAGLVAANGAAAGDGRAAASATSSDAAPRFDTPAGIETLLKGMLAAPHGEAADAAAPAAKRAPAARRAGSPESSETAPKFAVGAGKPQLDPALLAAWQTNSAIQVRPALAIVTTLANHPAKSFSTPVTDGEPAPASSAQSPAAIQAAWQTNSATQMRPTLAIVATLANHPAKSFSMPVTDGEPAPASSAKSSAASQVAWQTNSAIQVRPTLAIVATPANHPAESFSMPVTDGKPAPTSSAQSPAASQAADGQIPGASGKTPAVELEVKLGLPVLGVTAGDQPNGQTASAAAKPAPLEAAVAGEPALPPETARGGQPPNAPVTLRAATGNPAGKEVDGAPASLLPAARVAPQPGASLPVPAKNPTAAGIEFSRRPVPLPAVRAAAQPGARTSITVTGRRPATVPTPVEPVDELTGVPPKPADPMPAQAALVPVQPGTPQAARPLSGDPDGNVPADEMTVPASLAPPPPAATASSSDSSDRRTARTQAATPPSRRSSGSIVAQVLALSGQVPRTVDSIPPAAALPQSVPVFRPIDLPPAGSRPALEPHAPTVPAEAAPASPAESLIPGADTQVRVLGTGTPDRDEVAFALQVKAMPTPEGTAQDAPPAGLPAAKGSERIPVAAQQGGVPMPDPVAASQKRASLPDEPDQTPARAARERHPDAASPERPAPPAGVPAGRMNPQASPDAQVRTETAPERPQATQAPEAQPVRPQDVQEVMDGAAKPDAVKATGVHDMKFEVTGGQQRVEVRLSERAGEVKMTVRTADEPLANTLRENLPALSARLAESGFKSEAWHPAASSTDELRHTAESEARGASHDTSKDADAQPRQQDREPPDGAAQRRPKSPQEAAPQKEKGKDFSWLISSLR